MSRSCAHWRPRSPSAKATSFATSSSSRPSRICFLSWATRGTVRVLSAGLLVGRGAVYARDARARSRGRQFRSTRSMSAPPRLERASPRSIHAVGTPGQRRPSRKARWFDDDGPRTVVVIKARPRRGGRFSEDNLNEPGRVDPAAVGCRVYCRNMLMYFRSRARARPRSRA